MLLRSERFFVPHVDEVNSQKTNFSIEEARVQFLFTPNTQLSVPEELWVTRMPNSIMAASGKFVFVRYDFIQKVF